ncbi:MAG: hypothetical protein GY938_13455 [Ketobacter sp.]|nr:hypothetical protein [Ketobacter sp.]
MTRKIGDRRLEDKHSHKPATKADMAAVQDVIVSGQLTNLIFILIIGAILLLHTFMPGLFTDLQDKLL